MKAYRTIAAPATASYIEKKSEFIAQLAPVQTNEEAIAFLEEVKRQHRKAKHHVYAYCLRKENTTRYSDDGEPQGTAGVPVLEVLQKNQLTDLCCVVTRYFGGILLGANGLVRAYSHSAACTVSQAQQKVMQPCYPVTLQLDYALYGKLLYHLPQNVLAQVETQFLDQVTMRFFVQAAHWHTLQKDLIDLTGNQIAMEAGALQYADFSECEEKSSLKNFL